jgi:hypothetical protein
LKLGFKHSIICNGTKCIIYQRGLGVLIDEETPIKEKRIFNKNSQHHQSLLGCIICSCYYPHGPIVHGCKHDQKSQRHGGLGMFS